MTRDILQVVADIDGLNPLVADDWDLDRLHALADEFFSLAEAPSHHIVWGRLFGRFRNGNCRAIMALIIPRLREAIRQDRWQQMAKGLTKRTTVDTIEATHPYLSDRAHSHLRQSEWEKCSVEWQAFRAAAAAGGEVWEFIVINSGSSEEGFVVVQDGRVVAECVTAISDWI